jgi:hypothetical protein
VFDNWKVLAIFNTYCRFAQRAENLERCGSCWKMENLLLNMFCSHIIQTLINGMECDFALNGDH